MSTPNSILFVKLCEEYNLDFEITSQHDYFNGLKLNIWNKKDVKNKIPYIINNNSSDVWEILINMVITKRYSTEKEGNIFHKDYSPI